ncbi:hypothetical protein C2845_PM17G12990 [Panicum miliaceum]|uniref:Zinc finger MYM-type protein 1-like n=1 Tax=Panicum miliaceum TaxID=4540 RepID=A0A3L6Q5U2_PANMI|nr:hypothetical protein C2845_PM17G12990 [Panicum miliaceum]
MKKKKAAVDLRSLWGRAGKAPKTASTSVPAAAPPSSLLRCLRFFLQQGLAFQGHDEIEDSLNQEIFPETLKWLAEHLEGADKAVLENALSDPQVTSPNMLKDLVSACARETTRRIVRDLGEDNFAVLACLFSDACHNEQLVVCLRYVDKKGRAVERLAGIVSVENPDASTIKGAIEPVLRDHSLSWSRVRGQGYDGVGNIRAHVKGLKKLITDESPSAHYVHCFAQELQLALVTVLKKIDACADFFEQIGFLVSVLETSCRKAQMLLVAEAQQVLEGLDPKKASSIKDDAGFGFHHKTVILVYVLYPTIRSVLIMVGEDCTQGMEAVKARKILAYFESFEFVFMTHLLLNVLGYTRDLSRCLRIFRDDFMANGIDLIGLSKNQLYKLRGNNGWDTFLKDVTSFCAKHDIKVRSMDDIYEPVLRSKGSFGKVKNIHRYRVEIFTSVFDGLFQEFNDRFDKVNTDFLLCVASLDPAKSFYHYDKDKLLKLAQFYLKDFSSKDLSQLPVHLTRFIADMREDERFRDVKSFVELSVMLVETKKSLRHPIVYKLLKLVLVLPVATASVEKVFSAMDLVMKKLRNRVGEQLLYDCLITFVEREVFMQVKADALISRFQAIVGV